MGGVFNVTVAEARGFVAVPADLDSTAIVMGCSTLGSGLSPFFLSGPAAVAQVGYGDGVDCLGQIIEQRQSSGSSGRKFPAALYTVPGTTTGTLGAINVTGVTGTSVVTLDSSVHPVGTYEARIRVVVGGTIGTAGILLVWSLDGGRTESVAVALGTAVTFTIPNAGVKFNFAAGTLVTGDIVTVRTVAPAPVAADIDAAFVALAANAVDFGLLVLEFPLTAALAAHVTTGLGLLAGVGKDVTVLARTRARNFEGAETEATWLAAVAADFNGFNDSRICVSAAYEFVTDAVTSRTYLRTDLAQFAADCVRVGRGKIPNVPADQPMQNVSMVDSSGNTIGHDEGPGGNTTGLSNPAIGNRFACRMRFPDATRRQEVFSTVPYVLYAADERVRNFPTRTIENAIKRTARAAGTSPLGGKLFYDPGPPAVLTAPSRAALTGVILQALQREFSKAEIGNIDDGALDTGLVQVSPAVTITDGNLINASVTVAPLVGGFLLSISFTIALRE